MSALFLATETTPHTARMRMAWDIPMDLVTDQDFGLESLIQVEAAIAAHNYLGAKPAAVCLRSYSAYAAPADPGLLHLDTVWDISLA